jgi:GT2 family glycosyltransferase
MLPYAAGEDREFCDRWLRHGYRMAYVPKATVYHAHELTFCTFWRQHFGYGRGAFSSARRVPAAIRNVSGWNRCRFISICCGIRFLRHRDGERYRSRYCW